MAILDKFSKTIMFDYSLREWLYLYRTEVQRFLDYRIHPSDHKFMWEKFKINPHLGKVLTENFTKRDNLKIDEILNLLSKESVIGLLVGARGSGKTALMCWMLEQLHRRGVTVHYVQTTIPLPAYVKLLEDPMDAEQRSVVFFDEAAIRMSARESMSKYSKDMSNLLYVSRHRDCSIIFASQHSMTVDVNIIRMMDVIFYKRLTLEESMMRSDRTASLLFEYLQIMMPKSVEETLYTDGEKFYVFKNPLPSFWSDVVSKTYVKLRESEAVDMLVKLWEGGMADLRMLEREMRLRGIDWNTSEIKAILSAPKKMKKIFEKEERGE